MIFNKIGASIRFNFCAIQPDKTTVRRKTLRPRRLYSITMSCYRCDPFRRLSKWTSGEMELQVALMISRQAVLVSITFDRSRN